MAIRSLISADKIQNRVQGLAQEIAAAYAGKSLQHDSPLLLLALLRGSFMFAADLARALHRYDVPIEIDFMGISSYGDETETSGVVVLKSEPQASLKHRHVLVVDDILESGLSLDFVIKHLNEAQVAEVKTAVLLEKPGKRLQPLEADFTGFQIDDYFVVGYGLDYAGRYRELPYIGVLNKNES